MTVFSISLVKDEIDIIERTLRHTAGQVDRLLVADNGSTDGTRDVLSDLERELPLTVIDDPRPEHYQSAKLTELAHQAADMGATWIVPVDGDEIWYSLHGPIADVLRRDPRAWIFTADLYDHVPTSRDDQQLEPVARMGWRRQEACPLLKVACRPHPTLTIHEGSHSADYAGEYPRTIGGQLAIRHFPYRTPSQFLSKASNGARGRGLTDLPETVSPHLREYGRILADDGPAGLERLFRERFWIDQPDQDPSLVFDPAPC